MKLGVLRLRERLQHLEASFGKYESLVEEMVESQMDVYKKLYLKERQIKNIIVVDDYISALVRNRGNGNQFADEKVMERYAGLTKTKSLSEIAKMFRMPEEDMPLLYISMVLLRSIMNSMGAELIWAPGVTLCDGIAYEYGEKNKIVAADHDFEKDIIACAQNVSKRYRGNRKRGETLEQIALNIFDSTRKIHGLEKRERLLLQLSTILHDCGKYISMVNLGECSLSLIHI